MSKTQKATPAMKITQLRDMDTSDEYELKANMKESGYAYVDSLDRSDSDAYVYGAGAVEEALRTGCKEVVFVPSDDDDTVWIFTK